MKEIHERTVENNSDNTICDFNVYDRRTECLMTGIRPLSMEMIGDETDFDSRDQGGYICQFTQPLIWNRMFRSEYIRRRCLSFRDTNPPTR